MKADLFVHRKFIKHVVPKEIFGGFVEHMGRNIYTGIFEPGHPAADADGFRQDVAALIRELDTPVTRYPGGNFVSTFDWKDGIGPVEQRPIRADYNWFAIETNKVGLHEFIKWCRLVGTEPLYTVNLGTGTPADAMECVEYCNAPAGSHWSDLRCKNGAKEPFGIRYWCLGNEMEGSWQIGQKGGQEYGRIAREAAKGMKLVDPTVKLILSGSCGKVMPEYGTFAMEALQEAYEYVDFLSLHFFYGNRYNNMPAFLASAERMDAFIEDITACCDAVRAKLKSDKQIQLTFDEWNVWYRTSCKRPEPGTPFQEARPTLEEVYNMADALTSGGLLMSLMDHADRVQLACIAQSVNVLAPIMTRPGGGCWRQTIFYPFAYMSRYGRGELLRQQTNCPVYEAHGRQASYCRSVIIHHPEQHELVLFALNRSLDDPMDLTAEFGGFSLANILEAVELHQDNLEAVNSECEETVRPAPIATSCYSLSGSTLTASLKPASWNMFRIRYGE